jgi:hypothetical protein
LETYSHHITRQMMKTIRDQSLFQVFYTGYIFSRISQALHHVHEQQEIFLYDPDQEGFISKRTYSYRKYDN